jgi:hypothetical protein
MLSIGLVSARTVHMRKSIIRRRTVFGVDGASVRESQSSLRYITIGRERRSQHETKKEEEKKKLA